MTWGKEWPVLAGKPNAWPEAISKVIEQNKLPKITGLDLVIGEKIVLTEFKDGIIKHTDITKEYKNKVPTHDPYTNPDAHIYYQCACGEILDPGTKSFAALNNAAMVSGWKIRFGHEHYKPYCVKCGEGVE